METLALLIFPVLILVLLLGFHVAFAMMGVALIFGWLSFGDAIIFQFLEKIDSVTGNFILAAVPLFIFMGAMLERAGIAEKLFEAINLWTWRWPGGLGITAIAMCTIFAATAGVVGATEAVVGLLAIPVMMKYGYNKRLISGTICAGGSLGTIIPPSITVIILGPVADVSVGSLFAGILIPGLVIAALYVVYVSAACFIKPELAPRPPAEDHALPLAEKLAVIAGAMLPPLVLIFAVLGTIIMGIAAPTEAAAIGALAAMVLAFAHGELNLACLRDSMIRTLKVTCMILLIVLAGSMFAGVFIGSGGLGLTHALLGGGAMDPRLALGLVLGFTFIAGFFLDWISIILIVIPVTLPVLASMGFDPVWFCVLFLIVIQTSYLTPPLAPAIFYLKGIAPPEIELADMYRGVVPFIVLHFVVLALILIWPETATWLPGRLLH